jgi:hypothetical protein
VIIISIFNPPIRATRVENGASRQDTDQNSSLLNIFSIEVAQAEDTSPMDINSQSNQKQESCGPNGSKDRILRSTSRSSSSREKTMEKSCSSAHKGKRTLWGRTSVSEIVIGIVHINTGRIILQFYGNT